MTTQHILFNLIVILGLPVGILIGWIVANRFGRNALSRARREADHLLQNAREQSEKIRKLEIAKAKEQWLAERATLEAEYQKRLDSVKNIERAMNRRDAKLRRFEGQLQEREEEIKRGVQSVQDREKAVEARKAEINALVSEYVEKLEKVSGLTVEDAKRQIVANLKKEAEHEAASLIRQIKDDAKRAAELEAQKIVTLAIERVAVDQVAERTSTHFKLPDEGIKGRLIGQEGRNIKVFEEQTGVQLLINNEDPTMVNISGFNPVAREVARQTLSRLVQSGKIHPRRIQDTVTRVRKKINREIIKAGEEAFRYLKLEMAHPEIVKLVGKLKYRTSYGQNVLRHSIEVAELCGSMAAELGLDVQLAKRSGLLHDIGKAIDVEREGTHPELGGEAGRKYNEHEVVVNAIESHHEDVEVIHPISILVAVCDAVSGSRPGARRASLTDYARRIETLEGIAGSFEGVDHCFAIQAGREIRVIVSTDAVEEARLPFLASDISHKIEEEMDYPGRVKVTLIREKRAVQYAGAAS